MNIQDLKIGDRIKFTFPREIAKQRNDLKMYLLTNPFTEWTVTQGDRDGMVLLYWGVTRVRVSVRDIQMFGELA